VICGYRIEFDADQDLLRAYVARHTNKLGGSEKRTKSGVDQSQKIKALQPYTPWPLPRLSLMTTHTPHHSTNFLKTHVSEPNFKLNELRQRVGLNVVSHLSHVCLICVSHMSHMCLIDVATRGAGLPNCRRSDRCIRRKPAQSSDPGGPRYLLAVRCQTKENSPPQGKPKEIKEMTPPGGCVLCGGFKGPAAALAAGALRAPVSVRGTLTKSAGRPRRRSRWERPPHTKPVGTSKAKGRP